jgi:hypothetical protein
MLVGPQYTQGLQDSGCKSNDPRLSGNSGFEISYERGSRAFCAPRSEASSQCVSKLFPLSVVFSAVSPSASRSFLPMCFKAVSAVGSVLRRVSIRLKKLPPNVFPGRKRSPSRTLCLAFTGMSCLCGSPSFLQKTSSQFRFWLKLF